MKSMIAEMVQAQVVSAQQKDMVDKFQHSQDFFAYALWMTQQPKECRELIQDYWFWLLSVKEDAQTFKRRTTMKKLIQTWFLLDDDTTWGEMFQLAALSAVGLIVFWALIAGSIILWG
jgi:hypothetical protein